MVLLEKRGTLVRKVVIFYEDEDLNSEEEKT